MRALRKSQWVLGLMLLSLVIFGCKEDNIKIQMSQMQTAIIFPEGDRVFIDVIGRNFIKDPRNDKDILAVTFPGPDHYQASIAEAFPGKKLLYTEGIIERDNISVELIPAARNEGDPIVSAGATDYLVLITSGDWKILYCGDLGQNHFTPEQLEKIGSADICFTSLENAQWCDMTLKNRKGFNLIQEINPRLVIPLRYKEKSIEYAITSMPVFSCQNRPVSVSRKHLPEKTSILLIDEMAGTYKSIYGLEVWP